MNFEVWCSVLVIISIQFGSMVNYAILETSYAKPHNTKVVDNEVVKFWEILDVWFQVYEKEKQ